MESLKEELDQKISKEYSDFVGYAKSRGADFVVENAYEIVCKQEMKDYLYYARLEDKDIKALLKTDKVLDNFYQGWLRADGNLYESLEIVIDNEISKMKRTLNREMHKKDGNVR